MNIDPTRAVAETYAIMSESGELDEAFHIDKVNHVYHDNHPASREFARHYAKAEKSDGGDHAASFHDTYDSKTHRSGFAGSGETHFIHRKTGDKFKVTRSANGQTFYGTDHHVSKI